MQNQGRGQVRPGRERFIEAALELFAVHGVAGTSLQMITDRVGVTKAALFHHFPVKQQIVEAITAPVIEAIVAETERIAQLDGAPARQHALLEFFIALVIDQRARLRVMTHDPDAIRSIRADPRLSGVFARIAEVISEPEGRQYSSFEVQTLVIGFAGFTTSGFADERTPSEVRAVLGSIGARLFRLPA